MPSVICTVATDVKQEYKTEIKKTLSEAKVVDLHVRVHLMEIILEVNL